MMKNRMTNSKKVLSILLILAISVLLLNFTSCSKNDDKTLYLYNWTYYTPDDLIKKFEDTFDVKVHVDSYGTNEDMYSKVMAGADGYDIVVPSQDYVEIMIKQGMLMPIDMDKFPNSKYINPQVLEQAVYDPEMKWCVPYYMGPSGIGVNKTKIKEYDKSWSIFGRKDLYKKTCMMDDMREVLGGALKYLGYSLATDNEQEVIEATEVVKNEWLPNLIALDADGYGKAFARGDCWVVLGYPEGIFGEYPDDRWDEFEFFIPKEGGALYIDSMCILKNAKHYDLAMEFINFIHEPENYAIFLNTFHFPSTTNTGSDKYVEGPQMFDKDDIWNCESKRDLGPSLEMYVDHWMDVRFAQ